MDSAPDNSCVRSDICLFIGSPDGMYRDTKEVPFLSNTRKQDG